MVPLCLSALYVAKFTFDIRTRFPRRKKTPSPHLPIRPCPPGDLFDEVCVLARMACAA